MCEKLHSLHAILCETPLTFKTHKTVTQSLFIFPLYSPQLSYCTAYLNSHRVLQGILLRPSTHLKMIMI